MNPLHSTDPAKQLPENALGALAALTEPQRHAIIAAFITWIDISIGEGQTQPHSNLWRSVRHAALYSNLLRRLLHGIPAETEKPVPSEAYLLSRASADAEPNL